MSDELILSTDIEANGQPGYLAFQLSGFRQKALDKTYRIRIGGKGEGAKDYVEGIITNIDEAIDA